MLSGENGIVRQAVESKDNTRGASAKEEIDLWISNIKMDSLTGSTTAEKQDDLLDRLVGNGTLTQEEADKLKDGETITIGKSEISLGEITGGGSGSGNGDDTTIAGKNYGTETDITVEGTPITVPGGATISGIEGEYEDPDEGIVIYIIPEGEPEITDWNADSDSNGIIDVQEKYDQFVWVPVPDAIATDDIDLATKNGNGIYPIAVAIDGTDANGLQNYRGALYNFEEDTDVDGKKYVKITARSYSATSGLREPSAITTYDTSSYLPQVNGILNTSYNDSASFGTVLQEQFNEMVKKVNENKGFWVGRYETSGMSNSTTTSYVSSNEVKVNVVKGTTTGINNTTWYRMYGQQKLYSKLALGSTSLATSSMIWGSQWEQIMIWMKDVENTRVTTNGKYFVTNSVGYGNFNVSGTEEYDIATSTSGPAATGSSEYFKMKNIYDLAGNVVDWSLEADSTDLRVCRGGVYSSTDRSNTRAGYRSTLYPYYSYSDNGSRTTLY